MSSGSKLVRPIRNALSSEFSDKRFHVRDVATYCRTNMNFTTSLLAKLAKRGIITEVGRDDLGGEYVVSQPELALAVVPQAVDVAEPVEQDPPVEQVRISKRGTALVRPICQALLGKFSTGMFRMWQVAEYCNTKPKSTSSFLLKISSNYRVDPPQPLEVVTHDPLGYIYKVANPDMLKAILDKFILSNKESKMQASTNTDTTTLAISSAAKVRAVMLSDQFRNREFSIRDLMAVAGTPENATSAMVSRLATRGALEVPRQEGHRFYYRIVDAAMIEAIPAKSSKIGYHSNQPPKRSFHQRFVADKTVAERRRYEYPVGIDEAVPSLGEILNRQRVDDRMIKPSDQIFAEMKAREAARAGVLPTQTEMEIDAQAWKRIDVEDRAQPDTVNALLELAIRIEQGGATRAACIELIELVLKAMKRIG